MGCGDRCLPPFNLRCADGEAVGPSHDEASDHRSNPSYPPLIGGRRPPRTLCSLYGENSWHRLTRDCRGPITLAIPHTVSCSAARCCVCVFRLFRRSGRRCESSLPWFEPKSRGLSRPCHAARDSSAPRPSGFGRVHETRVALHWNPVQVGATCGPERFSDARSRATLILYRDPMVRRLC